jgi:hypothetical protein
MKQLRSCARDLEAVLDPDPPLDLSASREELIAQIIEAAELLEPQDKIEHSTRGVLVALGVPHRQK